MRASDAQQRPVGGQGCSSCDQHTALWVIAVPPVAVRLVRRVLDVGEHVDVQIIGRDATSPVVQHVPSTGIAPKHS